jgi:ribosomal protein S18 acetylase RimI-like enzyme
MSLGSSDVGHRVIVRRRDGERDGRPQYSDVLGELVALGEVVVVRTEAGREVSVAAADVAAGKRIPPRPQRRAARFAADGAGAAASPSQPLTMTADDDRIDDLDLERIAALGWPGLENEWDGGWLLRAGGGWTGRANSVLPLGDPGPDAGAADGPDGGPAAVDGALARVEAWYRARGLPPTVQVPLPARDDLRALLAARGWTERWGAVVMTARIADVLATVPRPVGPPAVILADGPDPDWLAAYHYRGGPLPEVAVDILRAGAAPAFASVVEDGVTVAICRTALDEGWLGITAVEVDSAHRRRGLATRLLVGVLDDAVARGARWTYLQVDDANAAARTLYGRAGFTPHHTYRYYRPAGA